MEDTELREKVAHLEERAKSNSHRLDNLENKVEDIHELASSVKLMASEMKAMREDVNDMNERLKQLEEKPAKNWDNVIKIIITRNSNSYFGLFFSKIWYVERRRESMEYIIIASIAIAVFIFLYLIIKVEKIRNVANALFLEMEKNCSNIGAIKLDHVCDKVYKYLPSILKLFISEDFLKDIVQMLYNSSRKIAKDLLDDGKWNKSYK